MIKEFNAAERGFVGTFATRAEKDYYKNLAHQLDEQLEMSKGLLEISETHNEELLEDLAQMENLIANQSTLIHSLQEKADAVSELMDAKNRLIESQATRIALLETQIKAMKNYGMGKGIIDIHTYGMEPWTTCGEGYEASVRAHERGVWTDQDFHEWLDEHCMRCPYFVSGCYCCYGDIDEKESEQG